VHTLELAAPYAVAVILYLLAPLQSGLVRFAIASAIDRARAGMTDVDNDEIPYYLMPEMIADYVDYAADAAQVVPALLLPIVGAVYGLSGGVPAPVAVTFLVVAAIAALAMLTWLIKTTPSSYVSHKWSGYSVLTIAGIILNLAGLSITLALS
jgi:hypothetical protein